MCMHIYICAAKATVAKEAKVCQVLFLLFDLPEKADFYYVYTYINKRIYTNIIMLLCMYIYMLL